MYNSMHSCVETRTSIFVRLSYAGHCPIVPPSRKGRQVATSLGSIVAFDSIKANRRFPIGD